MVDDAAQPDARGDDVVELKLGDLVVPVHKLDSADEREEANVHWQTIVLLSEFIAVVRSRLWLDLPERRQRIEAAGLRVMAILMQAGFGDDEQRLQDVCNRIGQVFTELLPYGPDEKLPEQPNDRAMERLARVLESRRKAFGKLLCELLVNDADKAKGRLDVLLNHVRDQDTMGRVLDQVLG